MTTKKVLEQESEPINGNEIHLQNRFKSTRESIIETISFVKEKLSLGKEYRFVLPSENLDSKTLVKLSKSIKNMSIEFIDIKNNLEYGFNTTITKSRDKDSVKTSYKSSNKVNGGVWKVSYKNQEFYGFTAYHCIDRSEYTYDIWLVNENKVNVFENFIIEYMKFLRKLNASEKYVQVFGGDDYSVSNLSYSWDDAIIQSEVKTSLRESVDFWYKNEVWYRERKFPYKRGILIHGYPGNGKTLITKIIISLYDLNIVQFNFGNGNLTNSDLIGAFRAAKDGAPSLFLLEDVDRIFSAHEKQITRVTKDCLFNCLDGIEELDGVLVIATANHVEDLDNAFINRPSRFDTIIRLENPSIELKTEYLIKLFKKDFTDTNALRSIAENCDEMSMAFMKEIYFKSVINSLNDNNIVLLKHIKNALGECLKHFNIAKTAKAERETGFKTNGKNKDRKAGFDVVPYDDMPDDEDDGAIAEPSKKKYITSPIPNDKPKL